MAFQPLRPDRDLTVLIPARAGSKRIPGKNTKLLGGKPLIQWTIDAAKAANVAEVRISTDDMSIWAMAPNDVRVDQRKPELASDGAPDILWILDVLPWVTTPYIAICRPTSPFRTASTIRRGYAAFMASGADSLRAVEPVTEHPGKMWMDHDGFIQPVMPFRHYVLNDELPVPWHSMPTQMLPVVYKQNASLEITSVANVQSTRTISGYRVKPFFTDTTEGFDINTHGDWAEAEAIAAGLLSPAPSPSPAVKLPGS